MEEYFGVRYATEEEVATFKKIEALLTDDDFEIAIDIIGDFACAYGQERRKAYNKAYRLAKKLGVTVEELEIWYFIDN